MKTLYVTKHAQEVDDIKLDIVDRPQPSISSDQECLIKVVASGINPSDALAVKGYFHHAVLPRIPGRDFAGIVQEGPKNLIGKTVWGTGGAAGISFDGTQAEFIKLSLEEIAEAPNNIDAIVAGAQPLPYVTAYCCLVKRARIQKNETVVVVGALGQVGSAAMSICQWKKCHAIALVRGKEAVKQAETLGWIAIDTDEKNLAEKIIAANHGQKVNVILNSVGNIYWQDYLSSLAEFGRIVTIGAREGVRDVTINLFELYRANQDILGVNTVSFNFAENAVFLNELKPGFESKHLIPLAVDPQDVYAMEHASKAYQDVLRGSTKRVVIKIHEK